MHRCHSLLVVLLLAGTSRGADQPTLALVPWPRSVEIHAGTLAIDDAARIVAEDRSLLPLAEVLADELFMAFGRHLESAAGTGAAGDIVLALDPGLSGEAYTLAIEDRVQVRGGSAAGVAGGTATLLQAVGRDGGHVVLPHLSIVDSPQTSYRGLMVDVARQFHTTDTLEQLITLCRLYKIRYLQLHLTDDQSFTFPSLAFPKLATPDRHYTRDELRALVRFADARGVTLVPELDGPGHTTAMRRAMPALFDSIDPKTGTWRNLSVLCMGRDQIYEALDTLVGEICAIFSSSPFFHIGADEAWLGKIGEAPETAAAIRDRGLESPHDLFLEYIARMHEIVKRHGKKTLMWESFRGRGSRKVDIPRDIIVFGWETMYELPQNLIASGYTVINASWKPLYVTPGARWSPETIYRWNIYRWENWWRAAPSYTPIQLEATDQVIGGQICSWEMREEMQLPGLRRRLPALAERLWRPDLGRSIADFRSRLEKTDRLLERLVRPVEIAASGLSYPGYEGPVYNKENRFGDRLELSMHSTVAGSTIHYTLDGSEPTVDSPVHDTPLLIDRTTTVKARAFDHAGHAVGHATWRTYELRPITARITGLLQQVKVDKPGRPRTVFGDRIEVTFASAIPNATVRYTLDGSAPSMQSEVANESIVITTGKTLRARCFDPDGHPRGAVWERAFKKVDYQENLTTLRPVTSSEHNDAYPPEAAVDGIIDLDHYWDASGGAPQWLTVDLEGRHLIDRIDLWTYWDGRRFYQYRIEVSLDGTDWTQVVDMSDNKTPASAAGYSHRFAAAPARYVRVTMLANSANPGLHIVELRAFEKE